MTDFEKMQDKRTDEYEMEPMTETEFDEHFAYASDHSDVMEKAAAMFAADPTLPCVEIDGYIIPNRKLFDEL